MNIACVNCGAEFAIDMDVEFHRCPYCESSLYIDHLGTIRHLLLKPRIRMQEQQIQGILARWFKDQEISPKFSIISLKPVLLPLWLRKSEKGKEYVLSATSRIIIWGKKFQLPSGDFVPFDKTLVPEDYDVEAPDIFLESAAAHEGDEADTPDEEKELIQNSRLVHVPFCEVMYTLYGKQYSLLIDINTEQILADSIPPSAGRSISNILTMIAIGLFLVFLMAGALIPYAGLRLVAIAALCVPAYFLVDKLTEAWRT